MPLAMSPSQPPQQGVIWSKEGTGVEKSFSFKKRPQKTQKKINPTYLFAKRKLRAQPLSTHNLFALLRKPLRTPLHFASLRLTPLHSTYNPSLLRVQRLRDFAKWKLWAQVSICNLFALLMKHFQTPPHNPRLLRVQRFRTTSQTSSLFLMHLSIGILQYKIPYYLFDKNSLWHVSFTATSARCNMEQRGNGCWKISFHQKVTTKNPKKINPTYLFAKRKLWAQPLSTYNLFALLMKPLWTPLHFASLRRTPPKILAFLGFNVFAIFPNENFVLK